MKKILEDTYGCYCYFQSASQEIMFDISFSQMRCKVNIQRLSPKYCSQIYP